MRKSYDEGWYAYALKCIIGVWQVVRHGSACMESEHLIRCPHCGYTLHGGSCILEIDKEGKGCASNSSMFDSALPTEVNDHTSG